eukprot:75991-Chlamydomonas_euryale.AAC.1
MPTSPEDGLPMAQLTVPVPSALLLGQSLCPSVSHFSHDGARDRCGVQGRSVGVCRRFKEALTACVEERLVERRQAVLPLQPALRCHGVVPLGRHARRARGLKWGGMEGGGGHTRRARGLKWGEVEGGEGWTHPTCQRAE